MSSGGIVIGVVVARSGDSGGGGRGWWWTRVVVDAGGGGRGWFRRNGALHVYTYLVSFPVYIAFAVFVTRLLVRARHVLYSLRIAITSMTSPTQTPPANYWHCRPHAQCSSQRNSRSLHPPFLCVRGRGGGSRLGFEWGRVVNSSWACCGGVLLLLVVVPGYVVR